MSRSLTLQSAVLRQLTWEDFSKDELPGLSIHVHTPKMTCPLTIISLRDLSVYLMVARLHKRGEWNVSDRLMKHTEQTFGGLFGTVANGMRRALMEFRMSV